MRLCVEARLSEVSGDLSINLKDQVLVTENGNENPATYPFGAALIRRG